MHIIESAPQWITCQASDISTNESIFISFVYGHNNPADRKSLWAYLQRQSSIYALQPWVILGDFNAILSTNDRMGGSQHWPNYMDDFHLCTQQASLINVPYSGIHLTWHNGQKDGHTIQKKLDWILGNQELFNRWTRAHAKFLPRLAFDHSPMLIHLDRKPGSQRPQTGFKFLNLWADRPDFLDLVSNVWGQAIHGNPIFCLASKLQVLRSHLKRYHKRNTSHISARVKEARNIWSNGQTLLNERPWDTSLQNQERHQAENYNRLCLEEEAFYKQKSRIQWLHLGDRNTAFFHRSMKHRLIRNRIQSLSTDDGHLITDYGEIHQHAVHYYENLLRDDSQGIPLHEVQEDYQKRLIEEDKANMTLQVTAEEIKAALFSIPDGKSPGPDGYISCFFKKSWSIVGQDFISAVLFFFTSKSLHRSINVTNIVLVPKVENPVSMNDFRPIACCTVIYKCISKILANHLKQVLSKVIGKSQSVFLPGRQISDAILLAQELMHEHHRDKSPARCAMKIDLRKAFDTIRWDYIGAALKAIEFPQEAIDWITLCFTTPHFSVSLNGETKGFFQASRGIRQGDPLSPYLFVLAMEGLSSMLH